MPSLGWRWLLALSSIPSSLLLMFYKWTPESPRYLILQGKKAEALSILEKIARTNGTQLPKGVLGSEMETEMEETKSHPTENTHLLKPGEVEEAPPPVSKIVLKPDSKGPLLVLLSPELIKRTLLLWVVFFGNAFAYYGVVLLTTELKTSQNSCYPTEKELTHSSNDVNYRDIFIASFAGTFNILISSVLSTSHGHSVLGSSVVEV